MKQRLYDIIELFKRSFSPSFSEEEKKKLENVLQDDFLRKAYEQLSDEVFIEEKFREFDGYEYKVAFEKLRKVSSSCGILALDCVGNFCGSYYRSSFDVYTFGNKTYK